MTAKPVSNSFENNQKKAGGIDWMLIFIAAVLIVLGLIMQYSASSYDLSLVRKQGIIAAAGFLVTMLISYIPAGILQKMAVFLYILALGATGITRIAGQDHKGARRWIEFRGFTIQPSEFLKIALILALATVIVHYINEINNLREIKLRDVVGKQKTMSFSELVTETKGYLLMLLLIVAAALTVAIATKDLGTAIIIFGIGIIMILVVSPRVKFLIALICGAAVIAGGLIMAFPYRRGRIAAWIDLDNNTSDLGYQIKQGLYAIGSGGWFGKGLGRSLMKTAIPESHTDMIFSIVCEELGIIGGMIIIILFILLILRLKLIYDQIGDLFGKMVVVGVASHIAIQVFTNVAVITNLIPNTGVPLPFISYGGTSLLCLMIELGIVMSVRRTSLKKKEKAA